MATLGESQERGYARYNLAWDAWLSRAFVLNWEVVAYAVILLLAFVTRFWELGDRVMSHDESLHTYYAWRLYDAGDFQHTPLMHGPVIFHAIAFFYFLFGDSDFTARIYVALLGVALVFYPYLFRRWLGRTGAVLAALGILVSPMMLYYSRYIREDIPTIFYAVTIIYAMFQYLFGVNPRRPVWLYVLAGALVLMLASKAVGFMYVAIFGSFFTFYWLLRLLQEFPLQRVSQLQAARTYADSLAQIIEDTATALPTATATAATPRPSDAVGLPLWQRLLGHGLVLGTAAVLGYLVGDLLYYWQFARVDVLWVLIAATLALFVGILPWLADHLRNALRTNQADSIFAVGLLLMLLLGLIVTIFGGVNLLNYEAQVRGLTPQGTNTLISPAPSEAEALTVAQSNRNTARWVLLFGVAVSLTTLLTFIGSQTLGRPNIGATLVRFRSLVTLVAFSMAAVLVLRLLTLLSYEQHDIVFSLGSFKLNADRAADIAAILVLFVVLESVGFLRSFIARRPQAGLAQMYTEGLSRTKSAFLIIICGAVLGGVVAVYAFGVLDIVRPAQIWVTQEVTILSETGEVIQDTFAQNPLIQTEKVEVLQSFDADLGNVLLLWLGLPIVALVLGVLLLAIFQTPYGQGVPWADAAGVLLVALLVGGVLTYAERHSLEIDVTEKDDAPVAVDPNAPASAGTSPHDLRLIVGTTILILLLTAGVAAWRSFLPHHWDFLNRQPVFDILILMGALVLPWLTAYPIFLAGYELDVIPPPVETIRVMLVVTGSTLLFTMVVGLAWKPRVWLVANVVFFSLFMFFFTTIFTNGVGVFTGMVNMLGYWLEQHGVRRGSQPQYYYTFLLLPVYEFTPLLLSMLAGLGGVAGLFAWRNRARAEEAKELAAPQRPALPNDATNPLDMASILQSQSPLEAARERFDSTQTAEDAEAGHKPAPFWARPYSDEEEGLMRAEREWLGEVPFLAFVGYWAILIVIALSIAGEKMPWLTTHMTYPLTLIAGAFAGRIVEKLNMESLKRGGWLFLLGLSPVLVVATMRVLSPLLGGERPFQGQGQAQLNATNAWIAALVVMLGVGYFMTRLSLRLGWETAGRLAFASLAVVGLVLSARAAWLAAYQNYDYPTEFLVYAHSGPAVKTVLDEIHYISQRTNEGETLLVAYDDDSSWPMTWYLRDQRTTFFAGDDSTLRNNSAVLNGAKVIVVGSRKNNAVNELLGEQYYRFDYIRLWWPMQEYFNLNYRRVANVFSSAETNPAAPLYRDAIWDIWWNRDYDKYAQAQCFESRLGSCAGDANLRACYTRLENECAGDDRYDLSTWPVSDNLYLYVDKEIAAQIWDAGIGGESVAQREPLNAVDATYQDIAALRNFGREANLAGPRSIAVGADGRVYVADTENSRIVVFDSEGTFLSIIGTPSTQSNTAPGTLFQPWGIAIAPNGDIVVADTWNHRVQVFSPTGEWLRAFGEYGVPEGSDSPFAMWGPRALTVAANGDILVADTGGKRIRVYDSAGNFLYDIGSGGVAVGQLDEPVGIDVNPVTGEIYVADTWNQRIQTFTATGNPLRAFPVPLWYDSRNSPDRPYLAASTDGRFIAVSDMNGLGRNNGPRVAVFDLAGNAVLAFNGTGENRLSNVAGLAFGPDSSLYVLDTDNGRVVKFAPLPLFSNQAAPIVPPQESDSSGGAA
jgi:uncharacterized protein (TIGR03663 family)